MEQTLSIIFVKDFQEWIIGEKGQFIALTPQVCHEFDKRGIAYSIFEDFYSLQKRRSFGDNFSEEFIDWITSLDHFINKNIDDEVDRKINFAQLYGYHIKNMVDTLTIGILNVLSVLDSVKPTNILLVSEKHSSDDINFKLLKDHEELICIETVLPLICKQRGIQFIKKNIDTQTGKPLYTSVQSITNITINSYKTIKEYIYNVRLKLFMIFFGSERLLKKQKQKRILLLQRDWLGYFEMDSARAGHLIYQFDIEGMRLFKIFRRQYSVNDDFFPLNGDFQKLWEEIATKCVKELQASNWITKKIGIDLSDLFNERLKFFIASICPRISVKTHRYIKQLRELKIDTVVCSYKILPCEFSLIAAANILKDKIKIVQIEHGSSERFGTMFIHAEQPSDIYVPSSIEEAKFFRKHFTDHKKTTQVINARVWIDRVRNYDCKKYLKLHFKDSQGVLEIKKKKICYLPSVQSRERFDSTYPICWYFLLQKKLIRYFAEKKEYHFMVKADRTLYWLSDPIDQFITELKPENITFHRGNLTAYLGISDCVITDFPSTPTYEARLANLPVFSLHQKDIVNIREEAWAAYGKTMKSYADENELIVQIDKFLAEDHQKYIISMEENFKQPALLEAWTVLSK